MQLQMYIPRYNSEEVMALKIRLAINHGLDIEQDHNPVFSKLANFT
jgi:hypothetical protein